MMLCLASSSSRGLALQKRVLSRRGRREGGTEIEAGGRRLAQLPTVSPRVIDSGTSPHHEQKTADPGPLEQPWGD